MERMKLQERLRPDVTFVQPSLDSIKTQLMTCKTSKKCDDLLNSIFNPHSIVFDTVETPEEVFDEDFDIIRAETHPYSKDPGYIISVDIGKNTFKKIKAGIKQNLWYHFKNTIESVIEHEMVHGMQMSRTPRSKVKGSNLDIQTQKQYFSDKGEIMAYALQSVSEFRRLGYSDEQIKNRLRKPMDNDILPKRDDSNVFLFYTEFFPPGDPVIKLLFKNMYSYLK